MFKSGLKISNNYHEKDKKMGIYICVLFSLEYEPRIAPFWTMGPKICTSSPDQPFPQSSQ